MVRRTNEVRAQMVAQGIPKFELRHRMELALEYGSVSVQEMAAELGASRTTLSNYLHGRTAPRRSDLVVWALKCNVPLDWLLTGEDSTVIVAEAKTAPKRKPATAGRR